MPMRDQPEGTSREKLDQRVLDVATGKTQTTKFAIFAKDPEHGKVKIGETHRVLSGKHAGWWDAVTLTGTHAATLDPFKRHGEAMEFLKARWLEDKAKGMVPAPEPAAAAPEPQAVPEPEPGSPEDPAEQADPGYLEDAAVQDEPPGMWERADMEGGATEAEESAGPIFPASDLPVMEGVPAQPAPPTAGELAPAEREVTEEPPAAYVTKAGTVLSDSDIEALAAEAEAGYERDADGKWHPIAPAQISPQQAAEDLFAPPQPLPPADDGLPFPGQRTEGSHGTEGEAVIEPVAGARDDASSGTYESAAVIREIPAGSPGDPSAGEGIPADELGDEPVSDDERRDWHGPGVARHDDWLTQEPPDMLGGGDVFPSADDRNPVP